MHVGKHTVFCIVTLVIALRCLSQNERIDSLKYKLSGLKDSAKIDCLNALSEAYRDIQTDTALIFANGALKEANAIGYKKGIATAYYDLAYINSDRGNDFVEMEHNCEIAIMNAKIINDSRLESDSYLLLGIAYWAQSKYSKAVAVLRELIDYYYEKGDLINVGEVYNYLSYVEEERGYYERSLQYCLKGLEIQKKVNDPWVDAASGNLYHNIGDYETALTYYRKTESYVRANNIFGAVFNLYLVMGQNFYCLKQYDSAFHYYKYLLKHTAEFFHIPPEKYGQYGKLYSRLGEVHLAFRQYDKALNYLQNALKGFKKVNDINQAMWVLLRLGNTYRETGKYNLAIDHGTELLQLANETGARQFIRDAHFLLYQLFDDLEKYEQAYWHLKKYNVIKDAIDMDRSAQKLAFYKSQFEQEKSQSTITQLNHEKKTHEQQLKQSAQQKKFLVSGIISILSITAALLINIFLKRKNERNRMEIAENELQIEKLKSEREKAELLKQKTELEMQMLRAQMNPHFIFNSLNSINCFILQNNKLQASEYLVKFSKLVRLILQNSQAALISLESELESLQLYLELESVRLNNMYNYEISIATDIDTSAIKVPPLIIQPFVENAIWHGLMRKKSNRNLLIELYYESDEVLCCKITDNGIGRRKSAEIQDSSTPSHQPMGVGITSERIKLMQPGNEIDVIEIKDVLLPDGTAGGTEVLLKIPVGIN